jgi:hypothetical protein
MREAEHAVPHCVCVYVAAGRLQMARTGRPPARSAPQVRLLSCVWPRMVVQQHSQSTRGPRASNHAFMRALRVLMLSVRVPRRLLQPWHWHTALHPLRLWLHVADGQHHRGSVLRGGPVPWGHLPLQLHAVHAQGVLVPAR